MAGFGRLVRRQRQAAGLTQAELAELTGLSIRSISDIERGVTEPRTSSRRLLEKALGLAEPDSRRTGRPAGHAHGTRTVPRQLPAAVRDFVGRQAELATLTSMLDDGGADLMVVSVIGGTAGVGKTELALHWAHQVAHRFPDGQLYVNLRGYDARPAVTAGEALASFLRSLGVPGHELPPGTEDRAALYRTMLAGRRMLVVLDNAAELDQLRSLLPGSPTCAVIVTSRDSLPGLIARDGARRLDLDPLADPEAIELLRALIGARVEAAPGAAAQLAAQCSRLPLALRVAAELAVIRPASDLADLVTELTDRQHRLDLLDADQDPHTAIRAVLSWSYLNLSKPTARVFRLISLHPGADVDRYAAAALTGLTPAEAGQRLDRLARVHLVQVTAPGRVVMHDLLQAYAHELTQDQDPPTQRRAARARLFDHYLCTAWAAMDRLYPLERHRRPKVSAPAWHVPPALKTAEQARAWLDAERASFAPIVESAVADGAPDHAIKLAATLFRYFDMYGYYPEAALIHGLAYRAAQETGDLRAQADALTSLGGSGIWQGLHAESIGQLEHALAIGRQAGDPHCESRSLHILGLAELMSGRLEAAARHEELALALFRQLADSTGEGRALNNLASIAKRKGHFQQAIEIHQQALELSRRIGDQTLESYQLGGLADVYRRLGRIDQAIAALTEALPLYHKTSDARALAVGLSELAAMHLKAGDQDKATSLGREAVAVVRQVGDLSGLAEPMNALADLLVSTSNVEGAHEICNRLEAEQRGSVSAQDGK
jgi:transcriptional regulator with XRE-family HTH domain/tetratricopeptide (TPR) repeat protein